MKEVNFPETGLCYRMNNFHVGRRTLVFIHGLTGSSSAWWEYENKFENQYNILSIDLRGHGKSVKKRKYQDYKIKSFAQDINDLVNHLHIEKFILIGHSFGTLVALEVLLRYQPIVESAIFLSPIFGANKMKLARLTKPLLKYVNRVIGLFPFSSRPGVHIDYAKYSNIRDWDIKLILADILNTKLWVYLFCLEHIYESDYDNHWSDIQIPVLIIHGKNDTVIPVENAVLTAQRIENSRLILVDNANHLFVINNINETLETIKTFINELQT
jgi:pimeloyl-ACP methyl ester carboxylesterase